MPASAAGQKTQSEQQNAVLVERMEGLKCDVNELKELIQDLTNAYQAFRVAYTQGHADVVHRTEAAHTRLDLQEKKDMLHDQHLDKLDKAFAELNEKVKPLIFGMRLVSWVAAGFGISIIALIWAIITHQVMLTF